MTNPPKTTPQDFTMQSPDTTEKNIAELMALFPHCVTETHDENKQPKRVIDFDLLRQTLSSEIVKVGKERYQINWPGKTESLLLANTPIKKTLRPKVEESKDWETTQNLFIEGDNLDALKLLQNTYLGKVKMIYIDPPYNTGNDFIYKDSFKVSADEHKFDSGQADEEGNRLVPNPESKGRFHSDWLSMMYPRLLLAHRFLRDDGVIFISIDDHEQANLKRLCDEVFGENNFVANFTIKSNPRGSQASRLIAVEHENIIAYSKSYDKLEIIGYEKGNDEITDYSLNDEDGKYRLLGLRQRGGAWKREDRPLLYYPIFVNPNNGEVSLKKTPTHTKEALPKRPSGEESRWTWGKTKFEKDSHLLVGKNVSRRGQEDFWDVFRKDYLLSDDGQVARKKPRSVWDEKEMNYQNAKNEIKDLFGNSEIFDYPKPTFIVQKCMEMLKNEDDIILDFFAGSGTTAHAVMQLNAKDGGNRRFICVQLPEVCGEESEAEKAGYTHITEITKERIRRAGEKILADSPHPDWNKDIGFRVLAIDSTNMKNVYYSPADLTQAVLENTIDNFKKRSPEDLLFQVMLDLGLDLSLPMHSEDIEGRRVFFVNEKDQPTQNPVNVMMACFERLGTINTEFCKTLARQKPARAVFRDGGFKDDCAQTNVVQIFKTISPNTTVKVL